jgi:hypothetical protein
MKETVLKEALGIDVSKASLSMCLGSLTNGLSTVNIENLLQFLIL